MHSEQIMHRGHKTENKNILTRGKQETPRRDTWGTGEGSAKAKTDRWHNEKNTEIYI